MVLFTSLASLGLLVSAVTSLPDFKNITLYSDEDFQGDTHRQSIALGRCIRLYGQYIRANNSVRVRPSARRRIESLTPWVRVRILSIYSFQAVSMAGPPPVDSLPVHATPTSLNFCRLPEGTLET